MKKNWLRGLLLGVSMALLLSGGVAVAQPSTQIPPTVTGGPDDYGYTFEYSSASVSLLPGTRVTDDVQGDRCVQVPIGFSFEFYGTSYTQVWICADGYLTFETPDYNSNGDYYESDSTIDCGADGVVNSNAPNQAIYAYWTDLAADTGGEIWYKNVGGVLWYLKFDDVHFADSPDQYARRITFWVQLTRFSDDIIVTWEEVPDPPPGLPWGDGPYYSPDGTAVGIENGTAPAGETWGLTYFCDPDLPPVGDWQYPVTDRAAVIFKSKFILGDRVWYDTDQDGIQDPGEPPVQGIDVKQYGSADCTGSVLDSYTTTSLGNYFFLAENFATYCLEFSGIPAGWSITSQNQGGDDSVDSDADPSTARITGITISSEDDRHEDVGLYSDASISGHVWFDSFQDGLQGAAVDEPGVPGIDVDLYANTDCSGAPTRNATTDAGGNYLFISVPAGNYCLQLSSVAPGWDITLQDQGADDTVDSDADPATGRITGIVLGAEEDLDQDMGLSLDGSTEGYVWCQTGDEGIEDVTVSLFADPNCDGDEADDGLLVFTEDTNADGRYYFGGDLWAGPPGSTNLHCYVAVVDTADSDLGACDDLISPVKYGLVLNADDPAVEQPDFIFWNRELETFVPEPGSILLLGSGLAGLAGYATLRLRSGQGPRWRTRE